MRGIEEAWGSRWLIAACVTFAGTSVSIGAAADFLVESKVYRDDEEEPVSTSTTIFYRGAVYDFLEKPNEVTIFEPGRGRFLILDRTRQVRTEVPTQQVAAFTAQLQKQAAAHKEKWVQFLAEPTFEPSSTEDKSGLVLTSPWLVYKLSSEIPQSPDMVQQYREFSDWQAQLNVMLNPGALPPFARLEVNRILAARGELPAQVELTLMPNEAKFRRVQLRAEHRLQSTLLEPQRAQVDALGRELVQSQLVPLEKLRLQPAKQARR